MNEHNDIPGYYFNSIKNCYFPIEHKDKVHYQQELSHSNKKKKLCQPPIHPTSFIYFLQRHKRQAANCSPSDYMFYYNHLRYQILRSNTDTFMQHCNNASIELIIPNASMTIQCHVLTSFSHTHTFLLTITLMKHTLCISFLCNQPDLYTTNSKSYKIQSNPSVLLSSVSLHPNQSYIAYSTRSNPATPSLIDLYQIKSDTESHSSSCRILSPLTTIQLEANMDIIRTQFGQSTDIIANGKDSLYIIDVEYKQIKWISSDKKKSKKYRMHTMTTFHLNECPQSNIGYICSGHFKGQLCLWDFRVRYPVSTYSPTSYPLGIKQIEFLKHSTYQLFASNMDGTLSLFDLRQFNLYPLQHYNHTLSTPVITGKKILGDFSISPDQTIIGINQHDNQFNIYNLITFNTTPIQSYNRLDYYDSSSNYRNTNNSYIDSWGHPFFIPWTKQHSVMSQSFNNSYYIQHPLSIDLESPNESFISCNPAPLPHVQHFEYCLWKIANQSEAIENRSIVPWTLANITDNGLFLYGQGIH